VVTDYPTLDIVHHTYSTESLPHSWRSVHSIWPNGFCGKYTGPVLEHPGRGLWDCACVGLANHQVYQLRGPLAPPLHPWLLHIRVQLSNWLWISRCGDYWQQAELRTDGACRIMMMMIIPLSRELWPMINSVMPSCCSRMTAAMELVTRYTTPNTIAEIGITRSTVMVSLHGPWQWQYGGGFTLTNWQHLNLPLIKLWNSVSKCIRRCTVVHDFDVRR